MVAVIRQLPRGHGRDLYTIAGTDCFASQMVEAADRVATRQDQGVSDEQGDVHLHLSTNILNNPFIAKE